MTSDKEQRRRAIEETDRSFIVEASAGTGKTSTLINRILHLVLEKGPAGDPLRLSQICAITFTEKAAGEMKVRLRQHFEAVASANRDGLPQRRNRALEALRDLETASISTFHAFAVSLLKERPIEAGLDPRFTALDEIRSELFFREVWDLWIGKALSDRLPPLETALKNGIGLAALQDMARTLRLSGNAVHVLKCDSPPQDEDVQARKEELLLKGLEWLKHIRDPKDKLLHHLEKSIQWLKQPGPDCAKPSKPGRSGLAANWDGGKTTLEQVQGFIRDVAEFCDAYQKLPGQRLLHGIISWIKDAFLPEWERRKKAEGLLDFDDQLWLARDLLLKSRAVRREFQSRYATLLVDEFQDTDPVQWDVVRLLSADDLEQDDPSKIRPGPGRLFIVGDPKQSIYRFRSADIETYLEIAAPEKMQELGLERLQLTTNFRSVPSILRAVDAAFTGVMAAPPDGCYQPDYLPFGDQGARTEEPYSPSVHLLGDRTYEIGSSGTVREYLEREANRIAALIRQVRDSGPWKIQDSGAKKAVWRTPRYGDIAILVPVLSRADILEDALREMEIPYVLEGGKFYYARSEVSSAITVLRAVANPNDGIALYGALRSIFFGLSDEDLLRARIQGFRLDYRSQVPQESALHHPFQVLCELHRHRHERRASETLEVLLQNTGVREVLSVRGFQSLANLNKLSRTLRALQGDSTFAQVVDLLSTMDEEGLAESESRLMEERSDAVRILSIHKSKGLDFPIVFVAGLGLKRKNRNKSLLADFHRKMVFGMRVGSRDTSLHTPAWKELAEEERKRENAELVRLLYVALTRARDHMILCTHTQNWTMSEIDGQWVPETEGTRMQPLASLIQACLSKESEWMRWVDTSRLPVTKRPQQTGLLPTMKDWRGILAKEYAELNCILQNTPASKDLQPAGGRRPSSHEQYNADGRRPEPEAGSAVRLGLAFHEAMEQIDFLRPEKVWEGKHALVVRHRLNQESVQAFDAMLLTTLSSSLMARAGKAALSGKRVLRELPFVRPLGDSVIQEGKIDLLFEEEDGWVLVDYKTDWVAAKTGPDDFFREKYAGQIREYAEALRGLSLHLSSAYLLLARSGHEIKIF